RAGRRNESGGRRGATRIVRACCEVDGESWLLQVKDYQRASFNGPGARPDPSRGRLLQRFDTDPTGLRVLGGQHARDAHRADQLAVDEDGQPALEGAGARNREDPEVRAALPERVLERLGGPTEGDGGVGLLPGDLDAAERGAVEPLQHHEIAARIEDRDDD